jgi:hypothetical protein
MKVMKAMKTLKPTMTRAAVLLGLVTEMAVARPSRAAAWVMLRHEFVVP